MNGFKAFVVLLALGLLLANMSEAKVKHGQIDSDQVRFLEMYNSEKSAKLRQI